MSRFLKFIVHLVIALTIVGVAALAVPPFFGVITEIMDNPNEKSNLPIGSVTYAIPAKTHEVASGTPILVREDGKVYRYKVASIDPATHLGTVIDPTVSDPKPITVSVKSYVPKVVITIGYLGYLWMATKTKQGLLIIFLSVVVLIILYIISELWKKDGSKKDKHSSLLDSPIDKEETRTRKSEKTKKAKRVKTGGFIDEISENDIIEDEEPEDLQKATSEAHNLLKKEIAAATMNNNTIQNESFEEEIIEESPREKGEREIVEVDNVRPNISAKKLEEIAKRYGDSPDIVEDRYTKVKLLDYSDIIADLYDDEDDEDDFEVSKSKNLIEDEDFLDDQADY